MIPTATSWRCHLDSNLSESKSYWELFVEEQLRWEPQSGSRMMIICRLKTNLQPYTKDGLVAFGFHFLIVVWNSSFWESFSWVQNGRSVSRKRECWEWKWEWEGENVRVIVWQEEEISVFILALASILHFINFRIPNQPIIFSSLFMTANRLKLIHSDLKYSAMYRSH